MENSSRDIEVLSNLIGTTIDSVDGYERRGHDAAAAMQRSLNS